MNKNLNLNRENKLQLATQLVKAVNKANNTTIDQIEAAFQILNSEVKVLEFIKKSN